MAKFFGVIGFNAGTVETSPGVGATKGGQVSHFTQFDIDFNQQKSLLETRCSGALTRCWSAIAIEKQLD